MSIRHPRRRGALAPVEGTLLGCGSLALLFIVCSSIAIYFAVRNVRKGMSTDPTEIRGWLRAEVKCDPPKGYDCVRGFQATAMGSPIGNILVAPIGAALAASDDLPLTVTTFSLTKAPMADASHPKESSDRTVTETKDVVVTVSEKKVKAVRRDVTRGKTKLIEYQVPLRKSLVFLATGPADKFDQQAMDDFLATMRLDQPFDLPTEVKEEKEAKK